MHCHLKPPWKCEGTLGRPGMSAELDWEAPEHPVADALEGALRFPVHGCQDLRERPEKWQPQAQELVHVAVVVSIVPDMEANGLQESLHPVTQVPRQPEGPAQRLPKEGGGDTWGAAFQGANGGHCARTFSGSVSQRGFLLLPCRLLLSLLLQLCPSLPLFAIGFTVNEVRLAVKFAFIAVKGVGSQAQGGGTDAAAETLPVEEVALGAQPLHHVHTLLTEVTHVAASQVKGK